MNQHVLQHKLRQISEMFSDRTAIETGGYRLTYGDLDKQTDRIAAQLLARGVRKQTFIGIFMEDRVGIISALLGILKAGCVFVPLDPAHPAKRLERMIRATDLPLVICDTRHLERLEALDIVNWRPVECRLLEDLVNSRDVPGGSPPEVTYGPEDKVYIYFTSGTTGEPKAVLGKNKSLLHFIHWEIGEFRIDETFRFSQFTAPGFDVFLRDIFVPLCAGAAVCIPEDREILIDGRRLTAWLDEKAVTLSHCIPALFRLIHSGDNLDGRLFKHLKYVLLAGEKIVPGELKNWYRVFNDRIQLVNIYGPTETTLAKLFYLIRPSDAHREIMPVGKPIKGARVVILDEKMEICDELAAGELYIRTPYRSFGYYNDPGLNSEKFIQNPFSQSPDDIIYKTGDLARLLPDGNIELLGRIDRQVKIRGMRVELEEIESVMINHPRVKEAVVVKQEMPNDIILLLAGITPVQGEGEANTGGDVSILEQVKDHLAEHLPDYMQPARITLLERIPRKPNGKVDYDELPALLHFRGTEAVPPADRIEERLVETWAQVLGTPPPGVTHSFFELGGNSLNLMTLISRIHRDFDVKISLAQAFNNITVRKQARLLRAAAAGDFSAVEPAELKEYYPLSSAQKRLYILQQIDVAGTAYNLPRVVPLGPVVDREKIEHAFRKLIQRHESLMTSFEMVDGEPVQRIHKHVEFAIEDHPRVESAESIAPRFVRPFDLSRAPLLRVGLIETGDKKYLLTVDIHHIVSDGISLDLLERDFAALYDGEELAPLKLQYKDFSQWQSGEKVKEAIKEQEQYWIGLFEDRVPVLDIPTDFPRPRVQDFSGNTVGFEIAGQEINALREIARDRGATVFMVLLAVYNVFLSKISRQDDVVVGTAAAGRKHADLERIIGMFVNTLALRNHPKDDKSFTQFLESVKDSTLQAFENQDYPFEDLVEQLNVTRDTGRNPLFDTMFILNHLESTEEKKPFSGPSAFAVGANTAKFDLSLTAADTGKNMWFSLQYGTRLFTAQTIERFIGFLRRIISAVMERPSGKLSEIEIIPPEEKRQILEDFNKTTRDYPSDRTIHELFEEQVRRAPDAVALHMSCWTYKTYSTYNTHMTYSELNRKADQLASLLWEKGVRPDSIVGIMVERSVEMIVGILGILKAGGAYMPIDPGYPEERKRYMLTDSSAVLLLTARDINECREQACLFLNSTDRGALSSSSLAYVIYTSGSTGKPKGVVVEHRSVVNVLFALQGKYPVGRSDTYLLKTTYVFDVSVTELYGWFMGGGRLAVLEPGGEKDPQQIMEIVEKTGVTHVNFVPSMLRVFTEMVQPQDIGKLSGLKYIFLAGEALQPVVIRKFSELHTKIPLENLYGPTEATVYAGAYSLSNWGGRGNIPIGKPIDNAKLYILDKNGRLQPIGIAGELCIAGDGLARGYLNNPELTNSKFQITNHKSLTLYPSLMSAGTPGPLIPLYKTGDLARWLPDGNIEFLGRIDFQVKIRGFRIELGEIEKQLLNHPGIKDTAVFDRESDSGDKYLCAYIVSHEEFSVSQLSGYLAGRLPGFMVPSYFVRVDNIPLNRSGKVDRNALESYGTRIGTGVEYVEPAEGNEKIIADIWKEVLEIEKVGTNDNFFEIGGNSLKLLRINQKLKEAFNRDIPVVNLFRYTTVGAIARSLDRQGEDDLFTGYQDQVRDEIEKGKEARKQRLQKRRGGMI